MQLPGWVRGCFFCLVGFLFSLLIACGGGASSGGGGTPPAPTISASATPTSITAGQSTTLTWTTTNASGVSIDNGIGNQAASGSVTVQPTQTTVYNFKALSASGATATTSVMVTVNAQPPPVPTVQLSANPMTIIVGQSAMLTWATTNATTLSIDNGVNTQGLLNGSATVMPTATTTYTATAMGPGGTVTAMVKITVNPPPAPTLQFSGNPPIIFNGRSATLTWSTQYATSLTIDNGVNTQGLLNGSATVMPTATTTYTATAIGPGGTTTATATITVTPYVPGVVPVIMHHNDLAQDGVNGQETALTPVNVNTSSFGRKYSYGVDGQIYGQPLYLPDLAINGVHYNTVFVATENDSVYAFDANGGGQLWHVSLGSPVNNNDPQGVQPVLGITSTMAIDPGTGSLYVTAVTSGRVLYLHKLNVHTGSDQAPAVAVSASVPGTGDGSVNGMVPLRTGCYQRTALTLANGRLYLGFGHCNHGWVVAYDPATLAQGEILNTSPNGKGATIWQSGGGFSVDAGGNLYVETADDTDTTPVDPANGSYPDAFLKLSPDLQVLDYFIPSNEALLRANDADIGSGAPIVMPNHEIIGGGKDGRVFVLDSNNLGGFNPQDQNLQTIQTGVKRFDNIWGAPAYWNGNLYYHTEGDVLKAYGWDGRLLTANPIARGSKIYEVHGASPSISANGIADGIVWEVEDSGYDPNGGAAAILHAYDATNAHQLYDSKQAGSRDTAGAAAKFSVPTIADGHVFVPTSNQLVIYGLLNVP